MLNPDIETLFIPTEQRYVIVKSSSIKELAQYHGDISSMVPPIVEAALKEKFDLTVIAVVRLEIDIDAAGNSLSREVTYEPEGSLELQSGDILFVFGTNEKIAEFENM